MSCSSDSEEFYDAEDITPSHGTRKSRKPSSDSLTHRASSEPNVSTASGSKSSAAEIISTDVPSTNKSHDEILFAEPQKKTTPVGGRRKFRELRQKLQNDDEDCCQTGTVTPPNSQTSSVEGVFATTTGAMTSSATAPAGSSSKASHPFRIIEQDTISLQSINSLGRVARILGGIAEGQGMLPEVGRKAVSVSALSSSSLDSSISSTTTPGSSCKGTAPTTTASSTITTQYPSNATTIPTTLATTTTTVVSQQPQQPPALTNAETTTQYNNNNTGANERNPSEERTTLAPSSASTNLGMVVDHHHHNQVSLQEPDVIASTKTSANAASAQQQLLLQLGSGGGNNSRQDAAANQSSVTMMTDVPVAPPRRKKKIKCGTDLALRKSASSATFHSESTDLASPASTIESLTREFEHSLDRLPSTKSSRSDRGSESSKSSTLKSGHSLDIKQAIKGQFVVKPQDHASSRGKKDTAATAESSSDRKSSSELLLLSSASLPQQPPTLPEGECVASTSGASTDDKSPRGGSNRSSLGHYSLGPHRGTNQQHHTRTVRERRKSAGDENMLKDSATSLRVVRTHTDSGKQLSDLEILEQVTVLNLDTGERVPLSVAEDKLPQCINPLSLHIMRLTSEYVSSSSMEKVKESDEESVDMRSVKGSNAPATDETDLDVGRLRKKTGKLKRFVGSAMKKAKSIAQEVSHARHKEDIIDIVDNVNPGEQNIKLKASNSHKGPYEFEKVEHVQELKDEHEGPIWCMKFSCCGRLLATAGQDKVLRIWIVRDAFPFFQDMRTKYNAEKVSPTPSQESLVSHHSGDTASSLAVLEALNTDEGNAKLTFMPKPFCTYTGHTSDLLDVSWSKNYFILSSSMDKTVRLWHISRKECLCCFQHIDFVTAIVFHPRDDRYFLSGSLDGKLRLWNIPDKKVAVWNEVEGNPKLITAANFCQNGKFAVVGTYDGRCIFYNTDQLKYHTQIHVRSSRGRNATGRKISGIEPMPGEDKILVTSNDSRIRLYDLRDLNVSCKYKGCVNTSSQIKASFSHDGKFIISGSENRDIYIWKTNHDYAKFTSVRRDRNDFWEAIKAHNAVVTCAIFAPNPEAVIKMIEDEAAKAKSASNSTTTVNVSENLTNNNNGGENRILAGGGATASDKVADPVVEQHTKGCGGYVLVSADFNGCIKVFINKMKPKHSSLPASAMA